MSIERRYIWSVYILFWIYFIFFDKSYSQGDHIFAYLLLGWVPFAVLHWIWRPKNTISSSSQNSSIDERFKLLFKIVDKEEILEAVKLELQAEEALKAAESELEGFYKKRGYSEETFTVGDEMLDLDLEILEEYFRLDSNIKDLQLAYTKVRNYLNAIEEVNHDLEEGVGIKSAKQKLAKLQKKNSDEEAELLVKLEFSKAIGEELLDLKRKYGENIRDKKIVGDNIIEKVIKKHPEWEETLKKDEDKRKTKK